MQCACHFTEGIKQGKISSKRDEIKSLIKQLKLINPSVDMNIFNSIHKVNLSTVIGYIKNGETKNFLDEYWFFKNIVDIIDYNCIVRVKFFVFNLKFIRVK